MRKLRAGRLSDRLSDRIRNRSKTKPNVKKPHLVHYSDLLSTEVTDNHYETLITEDGVVTRTPRSRRPLEVEEIEAEEQEEEDDDEEEESVDR